MTSCHLIPTWHEWNASADDIMMTWFTLFVNLVTSCLACVMHACMYGIHALNKHGTSKSLSGLACMQVNSNLEKITASHFQVLNTKNANKNMPNMIPIAYLNENFMDCNKMWHGVNESPHSSLLVLLHNKSEKVVKTSFYSLFM